MAFFGVCIFAQVGLGAVYKTWGFAVCMFFGLVLEVVGYVGRIMIHNNPFIFNNFLM
jgi:hypothetical protein